MRMQPTPPPTPIRGLMLDAARQVESLAYYERFFAFCQQWNVNAVLFRLCDDRGSALRFASHPELLTHPHALDSEQMRRLVHAAKQHGVTLIPEIESFGHSKYITASPAHRDLLDVPAPAPGIAPGPAPGPGPDSSEFSGLCPVDPRTVALLSDLYREAAELFDSPYLHAGCDEVNWGGSQRSREALRTRKRHEIWAEFLNALHAQIAATGREMIVWADHVLRSEPRIMPLLDRRIILADWDYWTADTAKLAEYAQRAVDAGFRVIGVPAMGWCVWGPRFGDRQLDNVDAFIDAYRQGDDARRLGVIVSNWVPQRYLPLSIWDSLAYAGQRMQQGTGEPRQAVFARFVQQHFGAAWDSDWELTFHSLYLLPHVCIRCAPKELFDQAMPAMWRDAQSLEHVLRQQRIDVPPYATLGKQLTQCRSKVRCNLADFDALRLSVRYLDHLFWRAAAVQSLLPDGDEIDAAGAGEMIAQIAQRDRELCDALIDDWNQARPADDWRLAMQPDAPNAADHLLANVAAAAEFSHELAQEPSRLLAMLAAASRDGSAADRTGR